MRKKHSPAFKFKVAFEALSGKPLAEICQKYEVAQSLAHRWKDQLKNHGSKVFGEIKMDKEASWEREKAKLYEQIGKQATELEFLKKIVGE
jgi:transposase-like protein